MATVKQYATQARNIADIIALKMGLDIPAGAKGTKVIVNTLLIILSVIVKLLVDKGVITDQELSDAFAFVRDDTYPDEPQSP